MADLDEKYRPNSDDDDVVVAVKTNAEEEEESSTQRLLRELVAKKAKVDSTKQVWFPNNLHSLVVIKKHVFKLLQGCDINANLSIRVLLTALRMHEDYLASKKIKKIKNEGWFRCQKFERLYANNFIFLTLLSLTLFKIIYYTERYTYWERCLLREVGTQVQKNAEFQEL